MNFSLKTYIAQNGERFSLLFSPDEPGVPLLYPCAYISCTVRGYATHQTQLSILSGIQRLFEWERDRKLDLTEKLARGELMAPHEIDDLATHVRSRRNAKKGDVVSSRKFNDYWSSICKYIAWLTDEILPNRDNSNVRNLVEQQASRLAARTRKRVVSKARKNQRVLDEKFSDLARAQLLTLFRTPFKDLLPNAGGIIYHAEKGVRLRNTVMLRILYETGMRRGELLSLKLKSFVEASGGDGAYLSIERNHDDELDRRANQPVAKTLGRDVSISEDLEAQILEYMTVYRAELNNVGLTEESFIFCVHRSGKTQGRALSINGFNSAFKYFKEKYPLLVTCHPHAFRHDWNYRFSKKADELGISEKDEAESREQQMGWVSGSEMAKIYNQRHRREKAMLLGREIAEDTARPRK
ncbi:site-specific integrase [Pseudomonas cannabina pv. alisalensis]|uniref:Tyrosine-type recombinase/integrase n=1 Tax=Pseudomonas syringae pv. maculicola str. ES4326 TaxID=629265 RepID=A0A8T8C3I4_PSEYM|nr:MULTISPECIES: site-specific integrase [Pseudomonas syringae group]QHE97944.1 tyrosine-type recombinase/integrase [Pseudomonas syringae pv. maculicola str. ES4326]UBY98614.1 site-specific integrase [Pseudomonas cannabina pv. alisalensis]